MSNGCRYVRRELLLKIYLCDDRPSRFWLEFLTASDVRNKSSIRREQTSVEDCFNGSSIVPTLQNLSKWHCGSWSRLLVGALNSSLVHFQPTSVLQWQLHASKGLLFQSSRVACSASIALSNSFPSPGQRFRSPLILVPGELARSTFAAHTTSLIFG